MANKTYRDLRVWQSSMDTAMDILTLSKKFPADERGALTDPFRLASRMIPARISEGWRRRNHPSEFVERLQEAECLAAQTQTWIEFALRCNFLSAEEASGLEARYEDILAQLANMISQPEKYAVSKETVINIPRPSAQERSSRRLKKQ